jgi:hypothetical protein
MTSLRGGASTTLDMLRRGRAAVLLFWGSGLVHLLPSYVFSLPLSPSHFLPCPASMPAVETAVQD